MGKGPKKPPATEPSRKSSITERLRDGEAASREAPDPCRDVQEIKIVIDDDQGISIGDAIQIIPGKPPQARSAQGLIGTVTGRAAARLEMCIAGGIIFTGVVSAVSGRTATATVQGS
jgi:hypothetical protein